MPPDLPVTAPSEFAAALLQGTVTAAFALLCAHLAARYRRAWFQWWAGASALYLLRVVCIVTFLSTGNWAFLFLHQVFTGWTGVALLWAAFAFGGRLPRRGVLVAAALFPPVWSWIAIYQLDVFFWAALPAVVFLSLATLWTGVTFLRWRGRSGEGVGATVLATAFLLWGLHHLDYPFLRARGAWSPWGYYLDILFIVAVGSGLLLLVVDEQRRGLAALSTLSGDLERGGATERLVELLERPLLLPGVRGSALVQLTRDGPLAVRGLGTLERLGEIPPVVQQALDTGEPQVTAGWVAALPIFREGRVSGALVMTGAGRDPFAVLDRSFLTTLGRQVGAALAMGDLTARVAERTKELEHLSRRMLVQHEDERRRLARELHDETAQVLSAVKMQLGVLRDALTPDDQARLDRTQALLDEGIRGIRSVTHDLRPTLLDDLGLLPALRSLVDEFRERSGMTVTLALPEGLPPLAGDAELALFRALQEGLSNVARHAGATSVAVEVSAEGGNVVIVVADDGAGVPDGDPARRERDGHMGLVGMRERIGAVRGSVELRNAERGAVLRVTVPAA